CKTYLYESLVEPGDYLVPGYPNIMPDSRRTLSETQIWALVAYMESVGGDVTVTGADIESTAGGEAADAGGGDAGGAQAGGEVGVPGGLDPVAILQNTGCIGCHVLDGQGGPLGPAFDGIGNRLDAARIRTAILDPAAVIAEG